MTECVARGILLYMKFEVEIGTKKLIFDSDLHGLKIGSVEYTSDKGVLVYDKTTGVQADGVELQMSTNTSNLIPALRALGVPYDSYFDERLVIESQNNVAFYWSPSRLAAFYNKFSTDGIQYDEREKIIREAVDFLIAHSEALSLKDEYLSQVSQPCRLLGFYRGFPIFDSSVGFAKLQSRLGIHLDSEGVMISTPLDKYEADVYGLAKDISRATGLEYSKKKNRVIFPKDAKLLKLLGVGLA